jgi:hypothetical protein
MFYSGRGLGNHNRRARPGTVPKALFRATMRRIHAGGRNIGA